MIKIDRESTSFAETFLICITHLSELCADAKGKAERLFSVGFASRDLLWHSEIRGLSFSLLLLYSGNFHGSFGKIEDCSENGSHFTFCFVLFRAVQLLDFERWQAEEKFPFLLEKRKPFFY